MTAVGCWHVAGQVESSGSGGFWMMGMDSPSRVMSSPAASTEPSTSGQATVPFRAGSTEDSHGAIARYAKIERCPMLQTSIRWPAPVHQRLNELVDTLVARAY